MIDPDKLQEYFISIRQLVMLIAQATGKTEQQAAVMVSTNLWRDPVWSQLRLLKWRPAFGDVELSYEKERIAKACLTVSATKGMSLSDSFDSFGFLRSDVLPLLTGAGIAIGDADALPTTDEGLREALEASEKERTSESPVNDAEPRAELYRARARISELEHEIGRLRDMNETRGAKTAVGEINSTTLQRIIEAVEKYPEWRNAQNQTPNLKAVLGWQVTQQSGRGSASRVAHVAHHVIAEHFGLNTKKTSDS